MGDIAKLLELFKLYGIGAVVSVGMFFYLNGRLNKLEQKYEECMNARINEAYRTSVSAKTPKPPVEMLAVLPKPIKIERWDAKQRRK